MQKQGTLRRGSLFRIRGQMQYAEIIVDIALEKLDHPFTYAVPNALEGRIFPGSVVEIPFGARVLHGYVVGLTDHCDRNPDTIKEIRTLITGEETQEAHLVSLAAWMSRKYGSTMIRALKTVFPLRKKIKAAEKEEISFAPGQSGEDLLSLYLKKNQHARARVIRELMQAGRLDKNELQRRANVSVSVVRSLIDQGVLVSERTELIRRATEEAEQAPPDTLSDQQAAAAMEIFEEWEGENRPVLLTGVTGSGKTLVYMELIDRVLAEGKQVIVLIPEISLTWQTVLRFVKRFGSGVSFMHSRLTYGERYDQMKTANRGGVRIMVGPRSALFTPFPNLGLIILDEEHEESYHSENVPRYHARETAIERGRLEGAHVVFGSATPSVNSYYEMKQGHYKGVFLPERFGGQSLAKAEIVDMRKEIKAGNRSMFSEKLQREMKTRLEKKEQIMLFLNRRGYSGSVTCRSCGTVMKCPHCDVALTLHGKKRLVCHYCGYETPAVSRCPSCGSSYIGGMTIGTEQLEEKVRELFPEARVLRMDRDTTKGKDGHRKILTEFGSGEADVLIGTQMIVKGHDFPRVTLVGVILADLSLNASDYTSAERTYQLLTQAAGRAGRGEKAGLAVIQTYKPDHYSITAAADQDYEQFFSFEIAYRSLLRYPPAAGMTAVLGSSENEELLHTAMTYLRKYMDRIDRTGRMMTVGPAPPAVSKIRDQYREVIYFRSESEENLILMKDSLEKYMAINPGFQNVQIQFDRV